MLTIHTSVIILNILATYIHLHKQQKPVHRKGCEILTVITIVEVNVNFINFTQGTSAHVNSLTTVLQNENMAE